MIVFTYIENVRNEEHIYFFELFRSFAKQLNSFADRNQEKNTELPIGARANIDVRTNSELSKSYLRVGVRRFDARGNGAFYDYYKPGVKKKFIEQFRFAVNTYF